MNGLAFATYCVHVGCAALSVRVARRRTDFGPVVRFLCAVVVANTVRLLLRERFLLAAVAAANGAPLTGWTRVAGHLDQAAFLVWPLGLFVLALRVLGTRPWARFGTVAGYATWGMAIAALALGYPRVRFEALAGALQIVEVFALGFAFAALVAWIRRREWPSLTAFAVVVFLTFEALAGFVSHAGGLFTNWAPVRLIYFVMYLAVALLLLGWTWIFGSSSSSRRYRSS